MRKLLYFIISLAALAYLAVLCVLQLGWVELSEYTILIAGYGGAAIAAALAFVNFFGKGLKILLFLALIGVIILYVILQVNPELIF